MTLAIGGGQTSRVWALENAIRNNPDKNFEGSVLASDAFFPLMTVLKLLLRQELALLFNQVEVSEIRILLICVMKEYSNGL